MPICLVQPANAATRSIPPAYLKVAAEYGIPPRILYAVARTESGLMLTTGAIRPWPWTLNVEGQGQRFATRAQALQAIQAHLAAGKTSIDIGLMQVNWYWHREALKEPWTALDPYYNLRTGARILRDHYQQSGDWLTAIGRYHAPGNPVWARAYRARVIKHLRQLRDERG